MNSSRFSAVALVSGLALGLLVALPSPVSAAAKDYRFELAGKPEPAGSGRTIVPVRLIHVPDNKPVTDAIVFESKADMGPAGMAVMTALVKAMPPKNGVYRFEVEPSMAGAWAVTFAAKVQGEADTVRGSVTADLAK